MKRWTVTKEFSFEAAHALPHLPDGHKCKRPHGHSYKVIAAVSGELLRGSEGWLMDYADLSRYMEPIIERLDHRDLNEVFDFKTTAENLAAWIFDALQREGCTGLDWVQVDETEKTSVRYSEGLI